MNARLSVSPFKYVEANSSAILSTAVGVNDLLQEEFSGCARHYFLSNEKLEKVGYLLAYRSHLFNSYTLRRLAYRYGIWKVLKAFRLHGGNIESLLAKMGYSVISYEL